MLTRRGWWLVALVVAVLAISILLRTQTATLVCLTLLTWFLASALLFIVQVRLHTGRLYVERTLRDERGPVQNLWAHRTYTVQLALHSRMPVPSPYLRVSERLPFAARRLAGVLFAEGIVQTEAPLTIEYHLHTLFPGQVRFEGVQVQMADLQGFFYHRVFLQDVHTHRVLPAFAQADGRVPGAKRHNILPMLGGHVHRRAGSGSELLDLRDYLPGDPPKTIAWKASARRDRLMTKVFESEVPIRCTFFVDTSDSVRVGAPGQNALARMVELTAALAQAIACSRDLVGLCVFDHERIAHLMRPARNARHLIQIVNRLAEVANLAPATAEIEVERVLPLAHSLADEIYPQLLAKELNHFPWWLPWWWAEPTTTVPALVDAAQHLTRQPGTPLQRGARYWAHDVYRRFLSRFFLRERRLRRWRQQLAALLAVRYQLGPGGLPLLLDDDRQLVLYAQRFLAEHQAPFAQPLYGPRGNYLFAAPQKIQLLTQALLHAVSHGRDNELFVVVADLLELYEHLDSLRSAIKTALARHHQVLVLCPWPPRLPLPDRNNVLATLPLPGPVGRVDLGALMEKMMEVRLQRAYQQLRRDLGKLGVTVLCARHEDSAQLVLDRIERLRTQARGVR